MILLDTNVISEPLRAQPDARVVAWLDAQPLETLFLSVVTVAELRFGVARLPVGRRRNSLIEQLECQIFPAFAGRILPFDVAATQPYAEALANALLHGNLEANKDLRASGDAYADYVDHLDHRLHDDSFASRSVCLFARMSAGWLTLEVLDEGHGFEKSRRSASEPQHDEEDAFGLPSGRGLLVTSAMADRIRHRNGGRRLDLGFALVA